MTDTTNVNVVLEKSKDGGIMGRLSGRIAFPDKRYPVPCDAQVGDEWEVEITGENPKQTVFFFKFGKRVVGETGIVYVYKGKWGTDWMWSHDSHTPSLFIPYATAQPLPPQYSDVQSGVWEAEVRRLHFWDRGIRLVKLIASEEEMLNGVTMGERAKHGGFLWVEINRAWKEALKVTKVYLPPDGRDYIWYGNHIVDPHLTADELSGMMVEGINSALKRHETQPVVMMIDATSKYTVWWYYRLKARYYGNHVRARADVSKVEVEKFLTENLGIAPDELEILSEGYRDEEREGGDTQYGGHWVD